MVSSAALAAPAFAPDVIFSIGQPDGYCAEFALAKDGYAAFPKKFPKGVTYEVGKSKPERDWPFLHPSKQDVSWAKGGETHPFTIRFQSGKAIEEPTTFVIGYMGTQGDLSNIHVVVNGTRLPTQVPQNVGFGDIVHNPTRKGRPAANLFTIPAGTLKQGANTITITLEGKSWILYDYVALRKEAKPLAAPERPEAKLLAAFRNGPDAPMRDVQKIVFAVRASGTDEHWYANFGYYAFDEKLKPAPNPGGKLCLYDLDTRQIQTLLDDPQGAVRDPQVHYSGKKILFSYRPGGTEYYHLYEIGLDPKETPLRQLTDGEFDDIEPTYSASGKIIFVSRRAKRWVNCWATPVAILYGCDLDGKNIHALSGNIEHDNTPWPLPDGRILYTRWEYVDRSQVHYHHLWAMNPDGTRQMVYYGNMHPGRLYIDSKPIPGSEKIVSIFSPGHGRTEHAGNVGIIDPRLGPDEKSAAKIISRGKSNFRDPWAFSEHAFMVVDQSRMLLLDDNGSEQTLLELPQEWREKKLLLHEPRPVLAQKPERATADQTVATMSTGRLMLTDVYQGRNMAGIQRGEIKKLLILESLPKPINYTGGMEPLSWGGTFTLERIVGTVPVDPDGSANFDLPAERSFFFVALDENDLSVKRMQSFLSVMPGEVNSCVGCHEERTASPPRYTNFPTAFKRPPSPITPVADFRGVDAFGKKLAVPTGIPDVIDFARDVQPVLDAHCVSCHSPDKREGRISLVGHRTPFYSVSYATITAWNLVADGRNRPQSNYAPRTLGSSASRLVKLSDGSHYGTKLTEREKALIRLWCESGAAYPGTYAALSSGMIGGYVRNNQNKEDLKWPEVQAMKQTLQQNCASCHNGKKTIRLPLTPSDETNTTWWVIPTGDPRHKFSRQIVYDLTAPDKSLLLLAPLAKSAGGYESCGAAVLPGKDDPRYQTILAAIERTKARLDEIKRFDMPGFVPPPQYIRELKKYQILPKKHAPETPVDTYALEQQYWRSLWRKEDR
jgi:hypothetical protein